MTNNPFVWLGMAVTLGSSVQCFALPGWPSVLQFAAALSFTAFVSWFHAIHSSSATKTDTNEKMNSLNDQIAQLRSDLSGLRLKLGLTGG